MKQGRREGRGGSGGEGREQVNRLPLALFFLQLFLTAGELYQKPSQLSRQINPLLMKLISTGFLDGLYIPRV